jgi:catechol-2,3-dioxygenase
MVSPIRFAHVVLKTSRYQEMLDWWIGVLGAQIRYGNEFISFLSYDDEHHRLAIVNIPGLKAADTSSVGVEHVAFTFASLDDLFAKYVELKERGVMPFWTVNHGMTLSAYYRDPDGNHVECQVDAMDNREAENFMSSPVFAANPIGIDVDFDQMLKRRQAGESVSALIAYNS